MDNASDQDRHQHGHQGDEYRRIELITGLSRRRRWTPEEKALILTESLLPGASVAAVARRHNVNRGLLTTWRREAMRAGDDGEPTFVPLRLGDERAAPAHAELPGSAPVAMRPEVAPGGIDPRRRALSRSNSAGLGCGSRARSMATRCGRFSPMLGGRDDPRYPDAARAACRGRIQAGRFPQGNGRACDGGDAGAGVGPFAGDVFVFRAKRADRVKILIWDGSGLCLVTKRLEAGGFTWPPVREGSVTLSAAQLRLLFAGLDWTQMVEKTSSLLSEIRQTA